MMRIDRHIAAIRAATALAPTDDETAELNAAANCMVEMQSQLRGLNAQLLNWQGLAKDLGVSVADRHAELHNFLLTAHSGQDG